MLELSLVSNINIRMDKDDFLILEAYNKNILLQEGNPVQQNFNKWLDRGYTLGIVSPESTEEHMLKAHKEKPGFITAGKTKSTKKHMKNVSEEPTDISHKKMVQALHTAKEKGEIQGWTGPHKGEYVYNPEPSSDPSEDQPLVKGEEGSYIVIPNGTDEESTQQMISFIKRIGNAFYQESIIVITPDKKAKYIYLKRRVPDNPDFEKSAGDVHYNIPLATSTQSAGAGGRTSFKGKASRKGQDSFTAY